MAIGTILKTVGSALLGNVLNGDNGGSQNVTDSIQMGNSVNKDNSEVLNTEGTKVSKEEEKPVQQLTAEEPNLKTADIMNEYISAKNLTEEQKQELNDYINDYINEGDNSIGATTQFSKDNVSNTYTEPSADVQPKEIEVDLNNNTPIYNSPTSSAPVDNEANPYVGMDTDVHLSTSNGPNTSGVMNSNGMPAQQELEQPSIENQDSYLTKDEIKDYTGLTPTDEQVEKVNENFHEENGSVVLDDNAVAESVNNIADNNSNITQSQIEEAKSSGTHDDDKQLLEDALKKDKEHFLNNEAFISEDELRREAEKLGIADSEYNVVHGNQNGENIVWAEPKPKGMQIVSDEEFEKFAKDADDKQVIDEYYKTHATNEVMSADKIRKLNEIAKKTYDRQNENYVSNLILHHKPGNIYSRYELELVEDVNNKNNSELNIPTMKYYKALWGLGKGTNAASQITTKLKNSAIKDWFLGGAKEENSLNNILRTIEYDPELLEVWNDWVDEDFEEDSENAKLISSAMVKHGYDTSPLENGGELAVLGRDKKTNTALLKVRLKPETFAFSKNIPDKEKLEIKKEKEQDPIELSTDNINNDKGLKEGDYVMSSKTTSDDLNNGTVILEDSKTGEETTAVFDENVDIEKLEEELKQIEMLEDEPSSGEPSLNEINEPATKKAKEEQRKSKLKNWFKRIIRIGGTSGKVDTNVSGGGTSLGSVDSNGTKISKVSETPKGSGLHSSGENLKGGNSSLSLKDSNVSNKLSSNSDVSADTSIGIKPTGNKLKSIEDKEGTNNYKLPKTNSAVQTAKKQLKEDKEGTKTNRQLNKETSPKLKGTKYGGNSKQMFTANVHSNSTMSNLVDKLSETVIRHYHSWNRSGVYYYFNGESGKVRYKVGGTIELRFKGKTNWISLKTISKNGGNQKELEQIINEINRG